MSGGGGRCLRQARVRPARAPAEVRRLVLPQGQARPRRAGDGGRHPGGRGGDRAPGAARSAAQRPALPGPRGDEVRALLDGRVVGDPNVSGYLPNSEIDDVAWVDVDKAFDVLTYAHDVDTLHEALARPRKTRTVIVLRHAMSRSRSAGAQDNRRPLASRPESDRPSAWCRCWRPTTCAPSSARAARGACRRSTPYARETGTAVTSLGGAQRGGRVEAGRTPPRARLGGARRRSRPGRWPRDLHPPAGPAVGLRRPGHRRSRAGEGRAARRAPAKGQRRGDGETSRGLSLPSPLRASPRLVHVIVVSRPRGRHETDRPRSRVVHPRPQDRTPRVPTFTS